MMRFIKKFLTVLGGLIVFGFVAAIAMALISMVVTSRGSGDHVASVDWLPKTASDITFREGSGLFYRFDYECTITPEEFQVLARESQWTVSERRDFYASGRREFLGLPPFRVQKNRPPNHYPFALVYEKTAENGGGTRVVYDPERQRLLVSESSN